MSFGELTRGQAYLFEVSGRRIRMDSKLVGSNIAKCSRLGLILSCIQVFFKSLSKDQITLLNEDYPDYLNNMVKRSSGQIIYTLNSDEKEELLLNSGNILYRLIGLYGQVDSEKYPIIVRVFEEQYSKEEEKISLKANKEIKANSLQSPHDEDAEFRTKGGESTLGFSVNLTETCSKTR